MILSANKDKVRKGKKEFFFLKLSFAIFLPQVNMKKIAVPFCDLKNPEHVDLDWDASHPLFFLCFNSTKAVLNRNMMICCLSCNSIPAGSDSERKKGMGSAVFQVWEKEIFIECMKRQ